MRLFVDLQCLQRADTLTEQARHAAALLRHARRFLPGRALIVGLLDEAQGPLAECHAGLCDRLQHARTVGPLHEPAVFLQPAPLLGDPAGDGPLLGRPDVLSCAVVHDLPTTDDPDTARGRLAGLYWLKLYRLFCPLSRHVAGRLRQTAEVPADAVVVTGGSAGEAFARFDATRAFTLPHRSRFPTGRYFVLPTDGEPGSLGTILRGHAQLAQTESNPPGLVVLGCCQKDQRKRLLREYARQGGRAEWLELLDFISDEEQAALYHRAVATLSPAGRGSFAWAAVEAMACGCPVLAADTDGHRELLQPHALFSPDDPTDVTAGLGRLLREPAWGEQLRREQSVVPPRHREEEVARRLWQHVARLLPSAPAVLRDRLRRPRLAFVSPYPPQGTDVADCTAFSLQALARYATVDVYTDTADPRRDSWVRDFYPISELVYLRNEYDRVITVLGDSRDYDRAIELHRRYGGPCLLHHDRLLDYTTWRRGLPGMIEAAGRLLGRHVTVVEGFDWAVNDRGQAPVQFLDDVIRRAAPVLVHSRVLQAQLSRRHGVKVRYLPHCSRWSFSEEELSADARRAARERLGVPPDCLLVVVPGPFHRTDGPLECLWAAEFLRHWGVPACVHLLDNPGRLRGGAEELSKLPNLEGAVRIPDGPLSPQAYRDSLLAADYAIAVRGPGFGQSTAALADCIAAGLITIANEDTAEAMEAPGYVLRVPDHLSPLLIAEQLANEHQAGRPHAASEGQREEYVRRHHFDRYAVELLGALGLPAQAASRAA